MTAASHSAILAPGFAPIVPWLIVASHPVRLVRALLIVAMVAVNDIFALAGTEATQTYRAFVRGMFRWRERLLPSKWCEKWLKLPAGKQETKPGPVSFAERPALREIIDSIGDPTITDIVFVGPTRIGKTFVLRMIFAYCVAGDPASMMWIDPTETKARDVSRKELQPMIAANPVLKNRRPKEKKNFSDLRMLFPAASFTMVGGNSPAQVAGDTVKIILGNEIDKYQGATEKEAAVAELARHRTESFEKERKHFWSCTPTLEEMTAWAYQKRGDQRRWFVPCPFCDTFQQLLWAQVYWDPEAKIAETKWDLEKVKSSARYRCENVSCTGPMWTDDDRRSAICDPRSHWRATAKGDPGWRSYHLNGLYGPLESNNVGELAVDFLRAKRSGFFADRQDFWNSRMGLPWKDNAADITVEKFAKLEREYLRGEAGPKSFKPDLFILSFDVQTNRLPWVVRAYAWSGESYLVDHGDAATWTDLDTIQTDYAKAFACTSYVIGDINFEDRRAETLEQIYKRNARGWYGAEGFDKTTELVRVEQANAFMGGREANKREDERHKIQKLIISTYDFKVELEKRLTGDITNFFYYQLEIAATEQDIEEQREYYKQRMDEYRRPRKKMLPGKPALEWHSRNKNNHANDCEVYGLALFWILQKRRAYAQRKPDSIERKVVEVKTT